jgi:hypothetical protein
MRRAGTLVSTGIAALMLSGCDVGDGGPRASTPATTSFTSRACGTYSGRGCAPSSKRVDLERPSFSSSTEITNPLFPISRLHSALLLGQVDGKPFRTETTLLPGTSTVGWDRESIPVLASQYVAYLDGRLQEVAIDRYAQADDGSVWYLGEDVFDYENGAVGATEGTWLAGKEGPPAMIMPAEPKVGDVFRPENIPGVVFEEVTVKSVRQDSIVTEELHLDGSRSDKVFSRGYGEFRTAEGGDLEALALAVPADELVGPMPAELETLATSAAGILESARLEEWAAVSAIARRMYSAWTAFQPTKPPPMVAARLTRDLEALKRAVKSRRAAHVEQEAIDVWQSTLDLQLRHRPPAEIDAERLYSWTQQLRAHASAGDVGGVSGAVSVLEWIRDRIAPTMDPSGRAELDSRLRDLRQAADARNLPAAADHAARLGARIRTVSA